MNNPPSYSSFIFKKKSRQVTPPPIPPVQAGKEARTMTKNKDLSFLITGCRRMEESSQLELYKHFYNYGMSVCLRYARNRESALEMLNDGFLKVFLKIDQYKSDYAFKPWLRRIIVNAAIDHYRKYDQKQKDNLWTPQASASTYNKALDDLELDDLSYIMKSLPNAYRMVFNLYVVEGLKHVEIAERLQINVGTSKSNLSKARQKMKELLRSHHDIHLLKAKENGG